MALNSAEMERWQYWTSDGKFTECCLPFKETIVCLQWFSSMRSTRGCICSDIYRWDRLTVVAKKRWRTRRVAQNQNGVPRPTRWRHHRRGRTHPRCRGNQQVCLPLHWQNKLFNIAATTETRNPDRFKMTRGLRNQVIMFCHVTHYLLTWVLLKNLDVRLKNK